MNADYAGALSADEEDDFSGYLSDERSLGDILKTS